MSNEVTRPDDAGDDGFHGSIHGFKGGSLLRWSAQTHWVDRDGLTPPSPLLVVAIDEILKCWKDSKPEIISAKPLPDPDELNEAIPIKEWEIGIGGLPRPPWAHTICVYLVNIGTGEFYTYSNSTSGAHIAYDALKEAVIVMRSLRGARVMPLVGLAERPMKTKFGMTARPHFEIMGWKTPGDDSALPNRPAPQLSGPSGPSGPAAAPASAYSASAASVQPQESKPGKPAINLAKETLDAMGEPKPMTPSEFFNDEIPF